MSLVACQQPVSVEVASILLYNRNRPLALAASLSGTVEVALILLYYRSRPLALAASLSGTMEVASILLYYRKRFGLWPPPPLLKIYLILAFALLEGKITIVYYFVTPFFVLHISSTQKKPTPPKPWDSACRANSSLHSGAATS
jgi:hypothetical protein